MRLGVAEALGFGSFHEYAEARLGVSARMAYERVRVVEALAELPLTRETLAAGGISYSAVRELSRVMRQQARRPGSCTAIATADLTGAPRLQ